MKYSLFETPYTQEAVELYTEVFSNSEGEAEGKSIGNLVSNLISTTQPEDLIGCIAIENDALVGCIFFSRIIVPSRQNAFILSPVAVSSAAQRLGIGQKLINYGLELLRSKKVDLVFTYGDPAFYSKTGFYKITEDIIKAPYPLSQPIGWLAQSLDGKPIQPM